MLKPILNESEEAILTAERRLLGALQEALTRFDVAPEERETLRRSIRQLDEVFLLVVVGEFNAGKSAFINALLGQRVLEEGVTPTTTRIHLLGYGEKVDRNLDAEGVERITAPLEILREINIVDTPGTNAIFREHEAITREFVPRSDMVLFVTSADRPFTESERQFLERIRDWGKKVVVVVNKIDILEQMGEVAEIEAFIAENARHLLGFTPEVYPISARQALRAGEKHDAALRAASRFDALERAIVATLDEQERIRLKLRNPLGVGQRLIADTIDVIKARLDLLRDDITAIGDIERQLEIYREDVRRDFGYRLAEIDNVLYEFENRGMAYFDETMRLARVFDLLNRSRLRAEFEQEVVRDVPQAIERRVSEIVDWLVVQNLAQWQAVMDHLAERRTEHTRRMVGTIGGTFDYDRDRLLATVGRAAKEVIDRYDEEVESVRMVDSLQQAVAETALVEVGAIGLGAILTALFSTATLDLTGILAAGTIAALGLFVIPARRRKVKRELHETIADLREQLMTALTQQFEHELERSLQRIHEAIAPYTRFVRAERKHLTETRDDLHRIRDEFSRLESEIERL
ncbi:MAG: dynamin family protein [Anaerolineae bacterium]